MSITSKVTAYGAVGVAAVGAGALWAQSLVQWVTQPSHLLPVAGISAVTLASVAVSKAKGKAKPEAVESPEFDQRVNELAAEVKRRAALPQGMPHTIDYAGHVDHITHRNG